MILEPMPLLCVYNSLVQVAQHHLKGLWSLYRGLRRAMSDPASSKVPCHVHMHMHIHSVMGLTVQKKGFQKGSRYEKMKKK